MSDTTEAAPTAGIGHNNPPIETPDEIQERLAISHLALIGRRDELLEMSERLPKADEIDSDWEKKLSDGIKAASTFIKASEARRVDEKEPFLAAERAVDGFFKQQSDPVTKLKDTMGALLTTYQRAQARKELEARLERERIAREAQAKAERERIAAQEEARRLARKKQADADAAAAAARKVAEAKEAEARAADETAAAAKAAKVKPAALSRSRSDLGSVASLRTVWTHEIEDPARVPRAYCSPDKDLIKAAIKAHTGPDNRCTLKIAGVRIFESSDSVVR